MMSGKDRAHRCGAGMVVFQPPGDLARIEAWHLVDTHLGRMRLFWRCGVLVWQGADGQRWNTETAGELNWRYVGPADPEPSGGAPCAA